MATMETRTAIVTDDGDQLKAERSADELVKKSQSPGDILLCGGHRLVETSALIRVDLWRDSLTST